MGYIKKTIIKKKIEGVVWDIYAKTSADLVDYSDGISVASKIASMVTTLNGLTTGNNSVDKKIEAASDALFEKIMGVTDASQLIEAFDTLKEVSDYLNEHGAVVQGFTDDISALKTAVGDSTSGLVKDTADLKTIVGDSTSGLVADVAALQAVGSVKVEDSETNGYIKINGTETQVYDDSAIAASKIVESDTRKFVTPTEKTKWNSCAKIIVAQTVGNLAETDLLLLDLDKGVEYDGAVE